MNKAIKVDIKNMEEARWKKDETPYFLFTCEKCGRWLYVKTMQKNKKCLSCRKNHDVNSIKKRAEIVKGINPAARRVKELQHELAKRELGGTPDFRAENDFNINTNKSYQLGKNLKEKIGSEERQDYYSDIFRDILLILSRSYDFFPKYLIEMKAEEYNIPHHEIIRLIKFYVIKDLLIPLKNDYFRIKK